MPRCAFVTFGCKVNQYDTQAAREALARLGWGEVPATAEADLYVVNTCCVTRESHGKGLQAIRRLAREHPAARIVVTGCSAESDADALRAMPGVLCALGNDAKPYLAEAIAGAVERQGAAPPSPLAPHASRVAGHWPSITCFEGHTRAFVKIEDGCNDFCSYCVVPLVRGRVRSRPPDQVVAEVERLVGNGYQEVVLAGIHLGAYGQERSERWGLVGLIERLLPTPGLRRLRLSSLELREVSDELVALVAACPILCPHFHIPLQSGDDAVLRAMSRGYTAGDFLRRLDHIRERIAEPAITTDVIVGFPGETDEQFRRTIEVARNAGFTRMHVFPYSDRPGTAAAAFSGKLPPATISARRQEMLAVASDLMVSYHRRFAGRTVEPLVEGARDRRTGLLAGYTERYVRVLLGGPDCLKGTIVPVLVTAASARGVRAQADFPLKV